MHSKQDEINERFDDETIRLAISYLERLQVWYLAIDTYGMMSNEERAANKSLVTYYYALKRRAARERSRRQAATKRTNVLSIGRKA
jgi:hypothetical protein